MDPNFEEKADKELKLLSKQQAEINDALKTMHSKNNDRRLRKFLIDMFNLIFGNGPESDHFWQHVPEGSVLTFTGASARRFTYG